MCQVFLYLESHSRDCHHILPECSILEPFFNYFFKPRVVECQLGQHLLQDFRPIFEIGEVIHDISPYLLNERFPI